jgi:hypothetical protein
MLGERGNGTDDSFGGTDGNFHYNDTWCLDIASGEWQELSCIGYIPVPREGHAAAMVDDVIYVFGGRDVNGKDLGDLAAFRTTSMSLFPFSSFLFLFPDYSFHSLRSWIMLISDQRWYMFQNMGPAPTPRSGHAMVAAHGKVFVVGGEANASSAAGRDDPSLIHILDSCKSPVPPSPFFEVLWRLTDVQPKSNTHPTIIPLDPSNPDLQTHLLRNLTIEETQSCPHL